MPERHKAASWLAELFAGVQTWDGRTGECVTMPTADYDHARAAADRLFLGLVARVDWTRVLIEAAGRCVALDHEEHDTGHPYGLPCGPSVAAALMTTDRVYQQQWTDPDATELPDLDQLEQAAADLAAAVRWRRP